MIRENFEQNKQLDKILKHSQFQEIIKAIILGNYSWACVLFLHFSGYDPLEYIPQETYSKLIQENYIFNQSHHDAIHDKKLKLPGIKLSWIKLSRGKHSSN
ncbi:HetP family heterocyst commitment protein [Sphaerospermopsis aphanizomenoides BCCUSP55]|uniref:HetP family heterocyst commitment protein n=1 Tax=Sphaerospermopsis aphanizomenoides TaxID=459663 RepID=UPI0019064DA6|nr:HetP family heterocyst commitment protein [Sphaerospermopsis aphanizomenoides]MBK1988571.1 HetP family heterocyst commitment protein [Sphaerospermopsis aphanizomenoides BCCUSP55]